MSKQTKLNKKVKFNKAGSEMDLKSKTICRFCLTDNEQEHFFDLFDQIDGSQTLVLKASHVLGLEVCF
jgi:hypothetical protein